MKISTKGRYGIRALIDLAVNSTNGHVSLVNIAKEIVAISIDRIGGISNIMGNRYLKVPDKHAAAKSDRKIRYF